MSDHYRLLLSLSQNLSKSNVKQLKYLCFDNDVLSDSTAEQITTGCDLFLELQRKACITPNNYDFLREKLTSIGRNDLAGMLPRELEIILGNAHSESSCFGGIPTPVVQNPPKFSPVVWEKSDCYTGIAHPIRRLWLQVSKKLTSEDTKNLAYIITQVPSSSKEDISAIELLQQLEERELISPDNSEFLIDCLKDIGRIDLASFLDLALRPQALLRCLDASHQHLAMKLNMLQSKNSTYATQVKTLKILKRHNYEALYKTVSPFLKAHCGSYNYRAVLPHSKSLRTRLQGPLNVTSVARMIDCTLASIFQFLESYTTGLKFIHDNASIDCVQLAKYFEKCKLSFSDFEGIISELEWNPEILQSVHKEVDARRTPIGAPAHVACTIIRDIAQELYGGELIEQESTALDKELTTLEMGHYTNCYKILMLQWLATLSCLATNDSDIKPVLDLTSHCDRLLRIVRENEGSIAVVWPAISQNIGSTLSRRICSHLKSAGIHLIPDANLDVQAESFDQLSLNFFQQSLVPSYTFLAQLLAIAFVGPDCLNLEEVSTRLMQQHQNWMCTQVFANGVMTITANAAAAFHERVEALKERSKEINQLCAPLIEQLTSD